MMTLDEFVEWVTKPETRRYVSANEPGAASPPLPAYTPKPLPPEPERPMTVDELRTSIGTAVVMRAIGYSTDEDVARHAARCVERFWRGR